MPEFLSAVSPQMAIISAGEENPYGHPSPELLQRFAHLSHRPRRRVQVRTDGHNLNVRCFVACPESATRSGRAQVPDNHENE
jgi:beta-lactamase superfamily II metal-dependent hydrolase